MAVAGLDVGTTGCKCTVYSDSGSFLNEAYEEYIFPADCGDRELDAAVIWESVKRVIKAAAEVDEELKAIGIASMGEAAVLLDEADQPLTRPILYFDPRGQKQIESLIEKIGLERLDAITKMAPSKIYTVAKVMWQMEHDPELVQKARRLLLMEDFIVYMLSGVAQIDYSLSTRTYYFDMDKLDWSEEILQAAGIPKEWLSKTCQTGSVAGRVRPEIARELNVSENLLIVNGAHDQPAAMIGNGVLRPGVGSDSTGTNECITTMFVGADHPEFMGQRELCIVPFLYPGTYTSGVFSFTGGGMQKWFRDKMAAYERQLAKEEGKNFFALMEELIPDEPSGLLVLPYFLGKGAPGTNPDARACIVGLTQETTNYQIYKALMEGVTYELRQGLDYWREYGIDLKELRATGGGAKSPKWLQIKADIYGVPIYTMKVQQGGNLACGMLAAIAAGLYDSVEEAEKQFIQVDKVYYPDPERKAYYDRMYEKYKKIYPGIIEIFDTPWE